MVRIICGYLFVVSAKLAHIQTKVNKLCVGTVPTAGTNPKLLPLPAKTAPPAGTKTNKHSLAPANCVTKENGTIKLHKILPPHAPPVPRANI